MEATKINDAIRQCLKACHGSADPMGEALKCLQKLRRENLWSQEEVDQVRHGLVSILGSLLNPPP